MSETFNLFDLAFFGFTFIFALIGFFRGFVREFSALLIWIISIATSYFISPFLSDLLMSYSDSKMAIYAASRIILFIFVFFALSFATSDYISDLKQKIPRSSDASIGVLFGILKSILIFAIIYSAVYNASVVMSQKQETEVTLPVWMVQAKSGSILKIPASELNPLVKKFVKAVSDSLDSSSLKPKNLDDKIDQVIEEGDKKSDAKNVKDDANTKDDANIKDDEIFDYDGYSKKDIQKMNRLINLLNQ